MPAVAATRQSAGMGQLIRAFWRPAATPDPAALELAAGR
jgi:hypothetical protein